MSPFESWMVAGSAPALTTALKGPDDISQSREACGRGPEGLRFCGEPQETANDATMTHQTGTVFLIGMLGVRSIRGF
jgi:hypothetical protein